MTIETMLETALRDSTSNLPLDPHARQNIADRLAESCGPPRRRWLLPAAAAAAVVAVATAGIVLAGKADEQPGPAGPSPAVTGDLPGYAVPPTRYFLADDFTGGERPEIIERIVRASDGAVVGTLPDVGGQELVEPQLAPNGRRVYAMWDSDSRLGYIDLITGKRVLLTQRRGAITSPTISADGSTLAYEWLPMTNNSDFASVVIRDLSTGHERVLRGAPSGPTGIPLALSPDGSWLALAPQTGAPRHRPLWLVRVGAAKPFNHPRKVAPAGCADGTAAESMWTTQGLYAIWHCTTAQDGSIDSSDVDTVDPQSGRITSSHHLAPTTAFVELAVVSRRSGPLFVTSDIGVPEQATVDIRDPARHWAARVVTGVNQLTN
jgi:hypothetical protein